MNYLQTLDKRVAVGLDSLVCLYQKTLSPDVGLLSPWLAGTVCSHTPHCSKYARECLHKYGAWQALPRITERVLSCTGGGSMTYDPSSYRVVFASGAPIGVSFLDALHEDPRIDLVGVMTMPDAASGRGMKIRENIIAYRARELGIDESDIHKPKSLRLNSKKYGDLAHHTTQRLKSLNIDYLVVVAYGQILPSSVLEIPTLGPINVHGSLLPKYRGASPLQSVFLDGLQESGVTIMMMDEGVDTGDMLDTLTTPLPASWTVKDLIDWIQTTTPRFLIDTLEHYAKGRLDRIAQDHTQATYTSKLTKEEGLITLQDSLKDVYRKYQAFALWPKIYFVHDSTTVTIERLELEDGSLEDTDWSKPLVADAYTYTLHKSINTCVVKPSGKKSMTREAFLNGYVK